MNLAQLTSWASDKSRFEKLADYIGFCKEYLVFAQNGLQAVIVSRNENHYRFYQYKQDGLFNVTRPLNSRIMFTLDDFGEAAEIFLYALSHIHDISENQNARACINRFVYTCQQVIGAALDALPSGKSNLARKINGDLFERFVRLIIAEIGVSVRDGIVLLPVVVDGEAAFNMSYQHDLIIEDNGKLIAIGSVKTSSKDRLDKIFVDKFLHNRLTGFNTPHFAVFLGDVQRKGHEPNYGIDSTFLTGHFKGYTIKLNPLDGVYYCDLRPNMQIDSVLKEQIRTFDCLLTNDIWGFYGLEGER